MKIYIISGEASGDLHAAKLVKAIKEEAPNTQFRGFGGDLMAKEGVDMTKHYKELAFMGFLEVAKNIRTILKNFKICKADILAFNPDVILFVDYPGFNLKIAKWAKENNIPTHYYIAPQLWAWKENRIKTIKQYVDKMYVILPFEKDYFTSKGYAVEYHGHPLIEDINDFKADPEFQHQFDHKKKLVALLPGSRQQEIKKNLPVFLDVANALTDYEFAIACSPGLELDFYQSFLEGRSAQIKLIQNQTYELLHAADAALVTSGTATLETALHQVPQLVCYKTSNITYHIIKRLIKVPYISLVNLILDKPAIKEIIQDDFNVELLKKELKALFDDNKRKAILEQYTLLRKMLGDGNTSKEIAQSIINAML